MSLACPYCGLIRPGLHNTAGVIRNIFLGSDPVRTIIYINIAFYILSLLLDPRGILAGGSPFSFLSPSSQSLFYWAQPAPFRLSNIIASGL